MILLPHNIEAERSIIGSIIIEPDSLLRVGDIIQPQDFYRDQHRLIYNACLDVYELGEDTISLTSIIDRLQQKGELEQAGGASYLSAIANECFTASEVKRHATRVKEASIRRQAFKWAEAFQSKVSTESIPELIQEAEHGLLSLAEKTATKKSPDIADILNEIQQDHYNERQGIQNYIETDHKFYEAIPRLYRGLLLIIGAYTSVGKSTLLAQMIIDAARKGAKCLLFSTEDSRKDKTIKLIANLSNISQKRIMTNNYKGYEHDYQTAEDTLKKWNIKVYDDVFIVDEMRLKIKKHKLQENIDIVALDYIQNIQGHGSQYEKLSEAVIRLQAMAKELQVSMIVCSQVNNDSVTNGSELIGLKGAGELAAAADIVLWLKRIKGNGNERHLDCEIRKNRPFGTTGLIPLQFSENYSRIERRMNR